MQKTPSGPNRVALGQDVTQCSHCRHLKKMGYYPSDKWTCAAFPDGIPVRIIVAAQDHRYPYLAGDNGIQFEQRDGESPTWEELLETYGSPFDSLSDRLAKDYGHS